ncbi:VOC family protein [Kribbella sp. NPDC051770]|uniref:VOC family protein n=1 Tax=Kribbella sp. NPDC051770 TaxID=3155413 RepID=UPI00343A3DE8
MADDLVERARSVVEALERDDVEAVAAARSARLMDWEPGPWMREAWAPRLEAAAGSGRRVVEGWRVRDGMARFRLEGDGGEAFVTVLMTADGLYGLDIAAEVQDWRFAVCIGCADGQHDELRAFWKRLVDTPLNFGDGYGRAPRWPDPAYPQQLHLDVVVPDLEAAEADVLAGGATKLRDSGTFRVYADPAGHPFCLYAGETRELARVVIDCPHPAVLADFWGGLLEMPERVEETADRIVIARPDGRLPMIALQRVEDYQAPRWPDPDYPSQLHLDVFSDDRVEREEVALRLGATKVPPQGGGCPVYADPAGHPFCLCFTGE